MENREQGEKEILQPEPSREMILVIDDSEMNRAILTEMLGTEYDILEADSGESGIKLIQEKKDALSLVLLDIVMPGMDGFDVLSYMNRNEMMESLPVIMISSEESRDVVRRAYDLGASDYISRPFDAQIVYRRVHNTIMLYTKQKRLLSLATKQVYEKEKNNRIMISILSQIMGAQNGESGPHILHINIITGMLLERLAQKTDQYALNWSERLLITTASALHDIGKIGIPSEILNKPGRLTKEEFETMKQHTVIGAEMLNKLEIYQDEELVNVAYDICRWHHERYDGHGYPDGLKEEEIPISAQVVSVADVYDALTSERVYKPAYTHEQAIAMIRNGECGAFNPLLLECLGDIADRLKEDVHDRQEKMTGEDREVKELTYYENSQRHFMDEAAENIKKAIKCDTDNSDFMSVGGVNIHHAKSI